jgi:pyruvate, orthophosphate dikinase
VKTQFIFPFSYGDKSKSDFLGGKGANLAEMVRLGLPVPDGFTISTSACRYFLQNGALPKGFLEELTDSITDLEKSTGKKLGDVNNPLLVSVRSGAKFSMPGMMETILNLGISPAVAEGIAKRSNNPQFAWDTYRRFIEMFGRIVYEIPSAEFKRIEVGFFSDIAVSDWSAHQLNKLGEAYVALLESFIGEKFTHDPIAQLKMAIIAVFNSWNSERAQLYRRRERIPSDLGTAVNIQAMVFGNLSESSGTGVAFTRNPATGEFGSYGDYLQMAQGEDVVAGTRNTLPLTELKNLHPAAHEELETAMMKLEVHYRDVCDIEFTIEDGKLWILQTRVAKRTAEAAFRIACQLIDEGKITLEEALTRVSGDQLARLMFPQFDLNRAPVEIARGIPASPGAAVGSVVFDSFTAQHEAQEGKKVILVRKETSPDDLVGMVAAEGILTSRGGKTSHAAVVARGMGKTAVCGAEGILVDESNTFFTIGETIVHAGDVISIDGTSGAVYLGSVPVIPSAVTSYLEGRISAQSETAGPVVGAVDRIMKLADNSRTMEVRANADTPEDAVRARILGAQGIGLCRTEHMFLGERRSYVERLVLAESDAVRKSVLAEMEPLQRTDFVGIMMAMSGLPVTVRLLDPPLHEFLPELSEMSARLARAEALGHPITAKESAIFKAVKRMHEANPMLGLRGVRLGILIPELFKMQVRALVLATIEVRRMGHTPIPEIMIPLVATQRELLHLRESLEEEINEALKGTGHEMDIPIGTMIETPRSAITASRIAEYADFFSFGTNDLTQLTWGFSRDDAEASFLPRYLDLELLPFNPFESLDQDGVGFLIEIAKDQAREFSPKFKLGVCGEHGGDPTSIQFFQKAGLDYVSCSPFRVPVARLEAGRAGISNNIKLAAAIEHR